MLGMPTARRSSSRVGATWGATREEALANLDEVIRMVVASMIGHGEWLPT